MTRANVRAIHPVGSLALAGDQAIHPTHLDQCRASGLTEETITLCGWYSETSREALRGLLRWRAWPTSLGRSALVMPYRVPGEPGDRFARVRPDTPRTVVKDGETKIIKYEQPKGLSPIPFFPPRSVSDGRLASGAELYITEGEKKAALLDQLGYATIGLAGVWNFHFAEDYDRATGEGLALHPLWTTHAPVSGRSCVIAFDSDIEHKAQVEHAAKRLTWCLLRAGAISVSLAYSPDPKCKGIDDFYVAHGEAATRALLEQGRKPIEPADDSSPLIAVRSVRSMRDAPVQGARIPAGYEIESRTGELWKEAETPEGTPTRIASSPIFITRICTDHYTGEYRADLQFMRDGRWCGVCVDRLVLCDTRTMVSTLAPVGAPVNNANAGAWLAWFERYESANARHLQPVPSLDRAGWHLVDGQWCFALDEPIGARDAKLAIESRGERRRIFGALGTAGERGAQMQALQGAWAASSTAAALICGAFAAPLLRPLGAPNFAIHLPGDSSRGKTSMLTLAASVYGDPSSEAWLGSWNTTVVAAELRAEKLCDLPLICDEIGAGDPRQTERLVYTLINGGGRARGKKDLQLRSASSWRTIVLSTGEHELAGSDANTGAQIRVVQLPVGGFGALGATEVDALRNAATENYGHLGRAWLECLLGVTDWAPFREIFAQVLSDLRMTAKTPLQSRAAIYWALLVLTEILVAQEIGLGDSQGATMRTAFARASDENTADGGVITLAERARNLVLDWVASEPESFPALGYGADGGAEHGETRAHAINGYRKNGEIWYIRARLDDFFSRRNISAREAIRGWGSAGWLTGVGEGGRLTSLLKINGVAVRTVRLAVG